jgi:hypothetical protein
MKTKPRPGTKRNVINADTDNIKIVRTSFERWMGFYGALIGRDVVLDEEGDAAHAKQSSTADRISTINLHAYVGTRHVCYVCKIAVYTIKTSRIMSLCAHKSDTPVSHATY